MNCPDIINYIGPAEFECVGLVARHCDLDKLCIAVEEAKIFDIVPLFCYDFVQNVLLNWDLSPEHPDYAKYRLLVCGGEYVGSDGKVHHILGLKRVWVYYAYARYKLINQFNDTPNGDVSKTNEWSMPTPLREINDMSNKYRSMGKEAYESVLAYLCSHKADFPKFDDCNCLLSCGCSGSCSCGKTKKLTGFKFKTVKKYD